MKKHQEFEKRKRELFLDRLAAIFSTKRKVVEPWVKLGLHSSLKFNTLKADLNEESIIEELTNNGLKLVKIPWAAHTYEIEGDKSIATESVHFKNGYYYVQNSSSFMPPLALAPKKGERILDACAAPGGKSLYIAELSNNEAELILNDKSYPRLKDLQSIMQRYDVKVDSYLNQPAQELDVDQLGVFDKILLDAQCSNEGRLDLNHPRAMRFWSLGKSKKLHQLQVSMLEAAYRMLKQGGELVYSTCTFAPEENELVISKMLDRHSDLSTTELDLQIPNLVPGLQSWEKRKLNPGVVNSRRVIPTPYMEGFFICKLKKQG